MEKTTEKFTVEDLMTNFDEVGFNTYLLINTEALGITKDELDDMLAWIYVVLTTENPYDSIKMVCERGDGGSVAVAFINGSVMRVAW